MQREGFTEEQQPTTGGIYGQYIINEWIELSELGRTVRINLLSKNYDPEPLNIFVAGLCDLLVQLKPKVQGRKMSDKKLVEKFMDFHLKYSSDPQKILDLQKDKDKLDEAETRKQTIFEIEDTIRGVIEELGITEWGN